MRAGDLEVVELLRIDLGESRRLPRLREVARRERGALAAVVPAAERGHEDRVTEVGTIGDAKVVGHGPSLRRSLAPQERPEDDRPRPDGRSDRDVDEDEPPREVRPVLELTDPHLDEDESDEADGQAEEERRRASPGGEVADDEDEGEPEHGHAGRVHREERVQPAEAGDSVAPGVRPGRGREGAGHEQRERCSDEDGRGART